MLHRCNALNITRQDSAALRLLRSRGAILPRHEWRGCRALASFMVSAHYRRPGHEHEYNNQGREVDQDVRHIASICPARHHAVRQFCGLALDFGGSMPSLPFSRHLAHRSAGVIGFGGSASALRQTRNRPRSWCSGDVPHATTRTTFIAFILHSASETFFGTG